MQTNRPFLKAGFAETDTEKVALGGTDLSTSSHPQIEAETMLNLDSGEAHATFEVYDVCRRCTFLSNMVEGDSPASLETIRMLNSQGESPDSQGESPDPRASLVSLYLLDIVLV